jgi:integrase
MSFKRKGSALYYFQGRTQDGYTRLSTGTDRKALALEVERMWQKLAVGHRAWDVLQAVLDRRLGIGALYDRWQAARQDVEAIRRDLEDVDLARFVESFGAVYGLSRPKAVAKTLRRLRWLIPEGQPLPRSAVTREYLLAKLHDYRDEHGQPVCANTLRRVHSAWSVFFAYLVEREVFEDNPMAKVGRPAATEPPIGYYELETVKRLVAGAPTQELRAAFALAYGGALELGAILALRREQVHESTQEVHAPGTKTYRRDRTVAVSAWAWPYIAAVLKDKLPTAYLFPDQWRKDPSVVSKLHKRAVKDMKLAPTLTLHHARHHWAVTHLRAGMPVALVQAQLGHSTPVLTLKVYGAFMPQGADRAHWRDVVEQDQQRRAATL